MQDFLQALAKRLNQLFDGKCPVYLGRIWQGEKTPCFYLQLPDLKRHELICGRVRREIDLELHFYADSRQEAAAGLSCDLVAEKLLRGLGALAGVRRAYRGWDLQCGPAGNGAGQEYLRFKARYVFFTTLELEAADGLSDLPAAAELMSYFKINNKMKEEE